MNNIFQKNILALAQKNENLADKLSKYIPKSLPKLVNINNSYNLEYKGILLHNEQNPLGEANEIFSMATNEPVSIHVVYGLGLGYLFQVVSLNSLGTVILYEPDLNVLWSAFTLVDFSNDILKKNVYITDNMTELSSEIYKKSNTLNTPQLLSLSSATEFDKEAFDSLVRQLQEIVGSYSLDLKFTKEKFYPSLKMLIENIPTLFNELPLARFKDSLKGKTAVVVSAGPTLDRNIKTLKKYRDKYVLFSVGTAVKTLIHNGLTPDFLCIVETYNSSKQIEGLDLKDVYFITEPYSSPSLRNFQYRKTFSHISANSPINQLWADICGENIEEYWTKGTVSYTALNCARILGCSKIILVGQDLAYIGGQCYSKDSAYKDLICEYNDKQQRWEISAKDFESFAASISPSDNIEIRHNTAKRRLERLNNSLYYVKGINGDMIPTESVYAAFVKPLSEFALHFNDRSYINTSLVGAQIDGFENLPLEDALKNSENTGEIILNTDFLYEKDLIYKNIELQTEKLKEASKLTDEGISCYKNLNNNLKRKKSVDEDILKTLKKLSLIYLNLSGNFADKCRIYDVITAAGKIDLDYEMKMMRNFDYASVLRISNKLYEYLVNSENGINEISEMLKGVLSESFAAKG